MQLSDILKDTDGIIDALEETRFQEYLKKLDKLPDWKKRRALKQIKKNEFGFSDVKEIFERDEYPRNHEEWVKYREKYGME